MGLLWSKGLRAIFKYAIFQSRQTALLWSKELGVPFSING